MDTIEQAEEPADAIPERELSPDQFDALCLFYDWFTNYEPGVSPRVFALRGPAGSGKTSLAREMCEIAGLIPKGQPIPAIGDVVVGTPTGKAAQRLKEKDAKGATTLHAILKEPASEDVFCLAETGEEWGGDVQKLDGDWFTGEDAPRRLTKFTRFLQPAPRDFSSGVEDEDFEDCGFRFSRPRKRDSGAWMKRAKLLLTDESSMIGPDDRSLLLDADSPCRWQIPILALGDPNQLPPVNDKSGGLVGPDFTNGATLETVHRARGGILDLATLIRKTTDGRLKTCGETGLVYPESQLPKLLPALVQRDYQFLAWTHRTRRHLNTEIRALKGHSGPLKKGEPIILKENRKHKLIGESLERALEAGQKAEIKVTNGQFLYVVDCQHGRHDEYWITVETYDYGIGDRVRFEFKGYDLDSQPNGGPRGGDMRRQSAFGYQLAHAITGHASQGSEWPFVAVVYDPPSQADIDDRRRWAYTGVTRAMKKVAFFGTQLF